MSASISYRRSSPQRISGSEHQVQMTTSRRTPRACDGCRQRKVKCDAVKPACDSCRHLRIPCTYSGPLRTGGKKRAMQSSLQRITRRVEELEQLAVQGNDSQFQRQPNLSATQSGLHNSEGSNPASSNHQPPQDSHRLMGCLLLKQQLGACELSDFDTAETFPLFSRRGLKWIHSRTGDPLGLVTFDMQPEARHYFPPWPIQQSLRPKACPSVTDTLPPRDLVEQYANAHFSSIMHAIAPLVDPVRFNQMVDLVYSTPAEMFYSPDCQACIHIFLVFAANVEISQPSTTLAPIDEDSCVQATLVLLPEILGGRWTITGLEAVLMLSGYYAIRGNLQFCEALHADAVRMVFALGGHIRPTEGVDSPQSSPKSADSPLWSDSHLRNLFWMCYSMDKFLSQRTGHPPCIRDDMCDLDLPTSYLNQFSSPTLPIEPATGKKWPPLFLTNLGLAFIKDRIFNRLFSRQAMKISDAELLKNIRELDAELEVWKSTIPPQFRPQNIRVEQIPNTAGLSIHVLLLHIEYYHCVAWVHSASIRHRRSSSIERGIESSIALCVEASRVTITYLAAMQHVVGLGPFWIIIYHPLSSVVTVFNHLLRDPLSPNAAKDLHAINCASDVFATFVERSPTGDEYHLEVVKCFVQELSRLAECALQKALKERKAV